jgi:hypothetical protein
LVSINRCYDDTSYRAEGLRSEIEGAPRHVTCHVTIGYHRHYVMFLTQKSDVQLLDGDQVHQFLQEHLLHWLEALGWTKKVSEGIHAISTLESITKVIKSQCGTNI